MRSTFGTVAFIAITQLSAVQGVAASQQFKHSHGQLDRRQSLPVPRGCFGSAGASPVSQGSWTYQSSSYCGNQCFKIGKPVAAITNGYDCYCADLLPSDELNTSECSSVCPGYGQATCGGPQAYNVWLTGINNAVGSVGASDESDNTSASSPPKSTEPSTVVHTSVQQTTIIRDQETIIQTVTPLSTAGDSSNDSSSSGGDSHSSSSTIGIAVGVVVGILGLAAIITFTVFYLRRRRRMKNAENGHARADSLNAFVAGGSTHMPPPVPANDSRLDPRLMVERRRMSAGSVFADNEDYSRRILKVTNPEE